MKRIILITLLLGLILFLPIFTITPEYHSILGVISGAFIIGIAVYKALYPLEYKNREIWTGKIKMDKSNKVSSENE